MIFTKQDQQKSHSSNLYDLAGVQGPDCSCSSTSLQCILGKNVTPASYSKTPKD